jgi:hypothetical protein
MVTGEKHKWVTAEWTTTDAIETDGVVSKWHLVLRGKGEQNVATITEVVLVDEENLKPLVEWTNKEIIEFREGVRTSRGWDSEMQRYTSRVDS